MSIVQIFSHNSKELRTAGAPDKPLFCLADVCKILEIKDASQAAERIPERSRCKIRVATGVRFEDLWFVDEPGLYRLIFRSNKEEAVKFQDWVFEEVLPTIRKTGKYEMPVEPVDPKPELTAARDVAEIYALTDRISPRYSQFLIDSYLDRQFPALPGDAERWAGVVEIAQELGLPVNDKNRAKLGKFVKAIVGNLAREETRLCNGTMRPIAVYPVTETVIDAVRSYFK